jgi:hypothetical protein
MTGDSSTHGTDESRNSLTIKLFGTDVYNITKTSNKYTGETETSSDEKHLGYGNPIYTEHIDTLARALLLAYSNNTLDQCKVINRSVRLSKNLIENVEYENVIDHAFHSVISDDALYIYICAKAIITGENCSGTTVQTPTKNGHEGIYHLKYVKTSDNRWEWQYPSSGAPTPTWSDNKLTIPYVKLDSGLELSYPLFSMSEPDPTKTEAFIEYHGADGNVEKTCTFVPKPVTVLSNNIDSAVMADIILHIVY